ncbi:MAG: SUMF1/EgtB/PvdO family nonheme iron enzyme [Planctomycetes bacterium]|nr:SUMF1/EgtB/PvdO family nonheme iron enzyme [Planctomycetota bacterium]
MFRVLKSVCAAAVLTLVPVVAHAVTIETVPVGNPGNAADTEVMNDGTTRYGSVSYAYRIGTTEVTNSQYAEFLNAVAASDPYGLYNEFMGIFSLGGITRSSSSGSYSYAVKPDSIGNGPGGVDGNDYTYGGKPVVWVSWYDSIRFANWLHNGQGSGDTETGAYTLLGGTRTPTNGNSITRNSGAKWFLPSEDEWYKAAYHKNDGVTGNYWNYPTSTNTVPNNNLPSADTGNSANFFDDSSGVGIFTTGNTSYPLTDAGAYAISDSSYGTFNQGGNMREWSETQTGLFFRRVVRGGSWFHLSFHMAASYRWVNIHPTNENLPFAFRVASIPEPTTCTLALAALCLAMSRRRAF